MAVSGERRETPPAFPRRKHAETPVWSAESYELVFHVEVKIDRGDRRKVVEIGGIYWKVIQKRGSLIADGVFRNQ